MKILKSILTLAFIISLSHSQIIEITLKDALKHAYNNNPELIKLENTIEAQESSIRVSYGSLIPSLRLTTGWTRTNQITKGGFIFSNGINIPVSARNETNNNYSFSLRSDVTLFDGFANYDRVDLEKETKTRYLIDFQKIKQDVTLNVLSSYITVLKNEQIVVINDSTLQDSRAQLERIKIFVEVGRRTITDVYTQDVQVAQNELALERSKNELNKSISDLAFNANLPLERSYAVNRNEFVTDVSYESLSLYVEQNSNVDALTNVALRNRYDYKSSQQNLDILQTNIEIARSSFLFPTLTGFGNYSLSGDKISAIDNQKVFTLGLTLSYPIFQGFQFDSQRQIAILNYRSAQEDVDQLENRISLEIKKAILDLRSLLKQIEITDRSIASAQQNKLLAEESYRVGIGTILDVNTASINLNNLLITKSNLIYDFILAQKTLEYYQGLLKY